MIETFSVPANQKEVYLGDFGPCVIQNTGNYQVMIRPESDPDGWLSGMKLKREATITFPFRTKIYASAVNDYGNPTVSVWHGGKKQGGSTNGRL